MYVLNNKESEKEMKTSKLVNDYVKAHEAEASIIAEIKAQTEDLHKKLKALQKEKKTLKSVILQELEGSNSKRLESTTNFVVWKPVPIKAYVQNRMLVNKEK